MKHKKYAIATVLLSGFFAALLSSWAFAAEPCPVQYEHGTWYNPSLYQSCMNKTQLHTVLDLDNEEITKAVPDLENRCCTCSQRTPGSNDYAQGATWLNSYASNTVDLNNPISVDTMYSSLAAADIDEQGIATAYIHGQVYSCGNNDNTATIGGMNSKSIYILKGTEDCHLHEGATTSQLESCSLKAKDDGSGYITNADYLAHTAELGRINEFELAPGTSHLPVQTWSSPSQATPIHFNVERFKNAEGVTFTTETATDGTVYKKYSAQVWIFRCPKMVIDENHGTTDKRCGTGNALATLTIREVDTPPPPKTCLEKYQSTDGYQQQYTPPTWFSGFDIYYNKCSGTSVLGSRLRVNNNEVIVKRSQGDSSSAVIAYVKPGATVNFDQFFFSAAQPVTKTIVEEGFTGAPGLPGGQWENRYQVISTINGGSNASWSNDASGITGKPAALNLTTTYKFENGHASGSPTANGNNSWKVGTGDTITQTNYGDKTNLGSAVIGDLKPEGITNATATIGINPSISVAAPYNFSNTAKADATTGNGSIVFAGETANVRSSFTTNPVANGIVVTTNGESNVYATKSPDSYLRLYTYYAGSNESGNSGSIVGSVSCSTLGKSGCEERDEGSNITLNSGENVNGATKSGSNISIDVPDINAGQWLCAIAAVYPATSGSAANLSTSGFSGWYVSNPSCVQIAKKPTFQIWNGNLYTRGAIQSNVANKRTVSGHNEITSSNPRAFGSWVEHGIIAGGNNNNAGSGAVFGYQTNSGTNLSNNPGGHAEGATPAVCKRAPLTIANQNCVTNNNNSGNGNSGVAIVDTVNLDDFKSTAAQAQSLPVNTNVVLSSSDKYKEVNGIRYFYNASTGSKIYLSTDNLAAGANYVVYSKGSVYINGNITYTNGGYTSPSNVPQLIIITDGSIFIDGSVTRVDAWLIAKSSESGKGIIRTCSGSDGASQDDAACSKQLRINGPIVARQLELNRVYGAATGNNSATPAEIINLSPATYVFSQSRASDNATLRTVYSKEIAPRW